MTWLTGYWNTDRYSTNYNNLYKNHISISVDSKIKWHFLVSLLFYVSLPSILRNSFASNSLLLSSSYPLYFFQSSLSFFSTNVAKNTNTKSYWKHRIKINVNYERICVKAVRCEWVGLIYPRRHSFCQMESNICLILPNKLWRAFSNYWETSFPFTLYAAIFGQR